MVKEKNCVSPVNSTAVIFSDQSIKLLMQTAITAGPEIFSLISQSHNSFNKLFNLSSPEAFCQNSTFSSAKTQTTSTGQHITSLQNQLCNFLSSASQQIDVRKIIGEVGDFVLFCFSLIVNIGFNIFNWASTSDRDYGIFYLWKLRLYYTLVVRIFLVYASKNYKL